MPLTFDQAEKKFKDSDINGLAKDTDGLRYLKIRSLSRPAVLRALFQSVGIVVPETSGRALFRAAFESAASVAQIEEFIKDTYSTDRSVSTTLRQGASEFSVDFPLSRRSELVG